PAGGAGGAPPGMPAGGGGGGGGRGPSPKAQLAGLVAKLDVLTNKPLHITLSDEEKQKVREQLQGLAEKEALTDEEAKEKFDTLLKVVEKYRATLEDAGYRFPAQGG